MYPYRFVNIHHFVQRVASDIVRHGYIYYVKGYVPEGKNPCEVDSKLLANYDIAISRWVRARRKKKGIASIHYARHQRTFVMFAPAKGYTPWFEWERGAGIRNITREPLVVSGYSISSKYCSSTRRIHVAVRIHPNEFRALKEYYLYLAFRLPKERLERELADFPFEPWAGVKQQRWGIIREVNQRRKRAGVPLVDVRGIPISRRAANLTQSPSSVDERWSSSGG